VTLSFLPRTPYAHRLAIGAHGRGKEVMLHLPMESIGHRRLGPGGVTLHMTRGEFLKTVRADLAALPYVRGVNNHMGSLLTRHPGHMGWLMSAMAEFGSLYFVDSRTTAKTVAAQIAGEHHIPHRDRDIFLDNDRKPALIRGQLEKLLKRAGRHGTAVGIGHPYPETLAVLEQVLPRLGPEYGVRLVPVSELFNDPQDRSPKLWHASLSPSPRDAKSSKP
jgi:polysaccharide deacetylase 2 family uncharacterized protein YibQ